MQSDDDVDTLFWIDRRHHFEVTKDTFRFAKEHLLFSLYLATFEGSAVFVNKYVAVCSCQYQRFTSFCSAIEQKKVGQEPCQV